MQLWAAFILGLIGSLHCAGMCGPLALALPRVHGTRGSFLIGRLLYNAGRIATYALIGFIFGLVGATLVLGGFQKWVSIGVGLFLLLTVAGFAWKPLNTSGWKIFAHIRKGFALLVQKRCYSALFALGFVNGFLPCGLVYVAAAGAAVTGTVLGSMGAMAAFGLGTLPVMLAIPLLGRQLGFLTRLDARRLVPGMVALIGVLLILRGLELGIPYLSPILGGSGSVSCH